MFLGKLELCSSMLRIISNNTGSESNIKKQNAEIIYRIQCNGENVVFTGGQCEIHLSNLSILCYIWAERIACT